MHPIAFCERVGAQGLSGLAALIRTLGAWVARKAARAPSRGTSARVSITQPGGPPAMAKPIPDDYPRVTPYLIVDGASAAIDFYSSVFGATERLRMDGP